MAKSPSWSLLCIQLHMYDKQTCHNPGLTGIYRGDGEKNSGFRAARSKFRWAALYSKFFGGPILFEYFFFLRVSICSIEHTVNIDSYSINILSRSRVECSVVERIGGYRSIFGRFVLLSSHRKALQTASPQVQYGLYSGDTERTAWQRRHRKIRKTPLNLSRSNVCHAVQSLNREWP